MGEGWGEESRILCFEIFLVWKNFQAEKENVLKHDAKAMVEIPISPACKAQRLPGSTTQHKHFGPRAPADPSLCLFVIANKWSRKYYRSPEEYISNLVRVTGCEPAELSDSELNDLWLGALANIYVKKYGAAKADIMMNELKTENDCH